MRWVRVSDGGRATWARVEGAGLVAVAGTPWSPGEDLASLPPGLPRLAPAQPGKIICVARNYRAHAEELGNQVPGEPLLFLKPPSAVVGPGEPIRLPDGIGEVHHEAELALVIGSALDHRASSEEARQAIFGLTVANDVTARTIQRTEAKFTRAKGFDTFCPVGPELLAAADPLVDRTVSCEVDGERRQEGQTRDMVHDPVALVRFIAGCMRLLPGDLVLTGTPSGVGPIEAGQVVTVSVSGVGAFSSPVVPR